MNLARTTAALTCALLVAAPTAASATSHPTLPAASAAAHRHGPPPAPGPRPPARDGIDDGPLAPALDESIEAQATAMKKLDFFVGTWRGTGWMMTPKGRTEFTQLEVVRPKLSGQLLLVEGKGVSTKDPGVVVHRALALVGYDPEKKQYTWQAHAHGAITTTLQVGPRSWQWELPVGDGMRMRYTASFTNRTWSEKGEMTRDGGKTWVPTMHFVLRKQVSGR